MGNELLRQILVKICAATWFAVLADETADITNNEQLSISIRWVNESYDVYEDFIGLVHVPRITSDVITAAIKDVLIRCSLPLSQCREQCYDGASNMMGRLRGVATHIQTEQKAAISIHCLAHCLNLCLQDAAKNSQPIRNALDVTLELAKLIKGSPKRTVIFNQCKEDLSVSGTGLKPLCPTRWSELQQLMQFCPSILFSMNLLNKSVVNHTMIMVGVQMVYLLFYSVSTHFLD